MYALVNRNKISHIHNKNIVLCVSIDLKCFNFLLLLSFTQLHYKGKYCAV